MFRRFLWHTKCTPHRFVPNESIRGMVRGEEIMPPHTRSAADFLPSRLTLPSLRRTAASCQGCELYQRATQTVFGEGAAKARVMFVGEMPGDREDQEGKPFVGPAGRLLDEAMRSAG